MANLFNNDIGLNYKGLINIGSSINQNISGSLQYLTDGDGNNLPIQVSTSAVRFGGSTGLNWDDTNNRLGIGTATPLGILHLKTTATTTRLLLDGDAAQSKIITYRTNGLQRFGLYTNATAESGANAGSDFALRSYNDAGSLLSTPLFIKRSTGHVGINQTAPTASLHVRGDAGSLIARFEDNAGTLALQIQHAPVGIGLLTSGSWIAYNSSTTQLVGIQSGFYYILNSTIRFQINLATNETRNLGNLFLGSIAVATSARLHVRGDGTNPIFRYENSAGTGLFTLDAAGTTLVYNPAAVSANLELRATHYFSLKIITNYNSFNFTTNAVSNSGLSLANSAGSVFYLNFAGTETSGHYAARAVMNFSQSSGIVPFNAFSYTGTINQTGGANGITRGVYVAPTLTAAADFRALDVLTGSTSAHKLIQLANAAGNKVFEVNAAQEIGLFGVTPILQPTTGIAGATTVVGIGLPITEDTTFGGYTVAQISQALINLGILKP